MPEAAMIPLHPPHPGRGSSCPAPALLDAVATDDTAPPEVEAHLPGCPACSGYLGQLREARAAFLKARPPELFLRQVKRRAQTAPRRRPLFAALGLGAAALLVAVVVAPRLVSPGQGSNDPVLLKGSPLELVLLRAGSDTPELAGQDTRVKAGDALRFAYTPRTAGHLLVLDLDSTGTASVFVPFGGERSLPLTAGGRQVLPGSVVLDAAPGAEWVLAVFSPTPIEAAPLLWHLEQQAGAHAVSLQCPGCTVTAVRLQKVP